MVNKLNSKICVVAQLRVSKIFTWSRGLCEQLSGDKQDGFLVLIFSVSSEMSSSAHTCNTIL